MMVPTRVLSTMMLVQRLRPCGLESATRYVTHAGLGHVRFLVLFEQFSLRKVLVALGALVLIKSKNIYKFSINIGRN
jgi:hypothetical protein